jgi:hypothetical protein
MITVCGFGISNCYNKVKLALLEKGVPFTEEETKTGSKVSEGVLRRRRAQRCQRRAYPQAPTASWWANGRARRRQAGLNSVGPGASD